MNRKAEPSNRSPGSSGNTVPSGAPLEGVVEEGEENFPQRSSTLIMNAKATKSGGPQYMMMRPEKEKQHSAWLLVCMGTNVGHRYPLGPTETVIGRSDRADILLDDDRVSSRHAELVRRDGRHRIYDLGSSNGTLVNAQRIDEIDLRDGDLIQLGFTVFRYVSGESAMEPARAQSVPARVEPEAEPLIYRDDSSSQTSPIQRADDRRSAAFVRPRRRDREEDEDVSFADMLAQLRRFVLFFWPYRWLIVGLGGLGVLVGAMSAALQPPREPAYFEVRLQSKASDNPLDKFEAASVQFFSSAATNFRSNQAIENTLRALGTESPSAERVSAIQNSLSFVNTDGDKNNATYRGTFAGGSANESLIFLQKHVELYLQNEIDKTLKTIRAKVDFLQGQLATTDKDLKDTENRLLDFKKGNIDGLPDQARQHYDMLFDMQKREADLMTEIGRLEAEVSVDQGRITTEPKIVDTRVFATRPYQQRIVELNRQLAQARANGLADDHPDIKRLKSEVEDLKRMAKDAESSTDDTEVERSANPVYTATLDRLQRQRGALAAARNELQRLRDDRVAKRAVITQLPQLEATYAELTRNYDATKALHTRIFEELTSTQMQYELEKASAQVRYEIITAPRNEYVSRFAYVMKRAFLAGIVGFALGIFGAAAIQARRLLASLA